MPSRSTLAFALLFQAGLIPLAFLLAWLLGVSPMEAMRGDWRAWLVGVIATAPMLVLFVGLLRTRAEWSQEIHERLRRVIPPLFTPSPYAGVAIASILAGVGEELLFRGVLQEAIAQGTSPLIGLVIASIVFGLMHWITPAYAVLATGLGFYLGGLYVITGTLVVPIVAHTLYDFAALRYYLVYMAGDDGDLATKARTNGEPEVLDEDASDR